MIIETIKITEQLGHVSAMGHRVPIDQGGEAVLKRRCLETLALRNDPPDEIRFVREREASDRAQPRTEPATPAAIAAQARGTAPEAAQVLPPPMTAPEPPPTPPSTPHPSPPATPVRRRHRAKPPSERP